MTRTILNWSELLDHYKYEYEENKKRIKKWSEMGEPENQKKVELPQSQEPATEETIEIKEPPTENEEFEPIKEPDSAFNQIFEKEDIESEENIDIKSVIVEKTDENEEDLKEDTSTQENLETPDKEMNGKATVLEIVYDCLMQDTETIPALYNKESEKDADEEEEE